MPVTLGFLNYRLFVMEIFAVAFLIVLNGLFAMSEMALVSSRKARLQKFVDEGDASAAAALSLNSEPTRFLSTIQIGITSVGVLSGVVGEATLARPLAESLFTLGMDDEFAKLIATAFVVVSITYLSIVFGELVPKRLAQSNPETIARIVATPVQLLALLVRPFVSLLTSTTELVLAIFPRKLQEQPSVTEEEIEALLVEGSDAGVIEAQEHQMVRNVFRLDDRQITSLMVPRSELVALDVELPTEENLAVIAASNHSRFPVLRGDRREIVGIVSAKHLLNQFLRKEAPDIQKAMQAAVFVPETLTGMELLDNFRASSASMVVVMDEYGQPQGIVTEQDIFEAIAGEFKPQHDDDAWSIQRADGSWLLDGLIPIPELKDLLGLSDVPEEDKGRYHTLAGMLMLLLGRLPRVADQIDWNQWRFEVIDLDGHRIDKIIAKRMTEPGDSDA